MALRQIARDTLPSLLKDLKKDISKPYRIPQPLPSLRRTFSLYDQINLIDNVPEDQLRFQGFDDTGFKVNGVRYEGSLLCVGNLLMSWSPKKFADITPESLSLFQILRPIPAIAAKFAFIRKVQELKDLQSQVVSVIDIEVIESVQELEEILIVGCGRNVVPVNSEIRSYVRSLGMKLEAVDSRNAASTYNILNEEGRIIAAALLPYGTSS